MSERNLNNRGWEFSRPNVPLQDILRSLRASLKFLLSRVWKLKFWTKLLWSQCKES